MQTEVAAELGIMPTMVRRWQRCAGKPGGEAASIAAGVASGSGVGDRAAAARAGPGADGARHIKKSRRHPLDHARDRLCADAAVKFAPSA